MTRQAAFRHSALILDSESSVGDVLAPAVRAALSDADRVFVAVSDATAADLGQALDDTAGSVEWGDAAAFYQRLGFAYESFRRFLADAQTAGQRLHVFAEPDIASDVSQPGTIDRAAAYLAYEAICNETYAGHGCEVTCVWDARRHPTLVIENARRLHAQSVGRAGLEPAADFINPRDYLAGRNEVPLELPPGVDWTGTLADLHGLPALRERIAAWAGRLTFSPAAMRDVVMAVNEIATNGLTHGKPPVAVYGWRERETLIVQVDDQGGISIPPLAGYVPPSQAWASERGLWLARQLADVVRINTMGQRTSVRLYFPRGLMHRSPNVAVLSPH